MKTETIKILQIRIHSNITEEENFYPFQFSQKVPLRIFLESLDKVNDDTQKLKRKKKSSFTSSPPQNRANRASRLEYD